MLSIITPSLCRDSLLRTCESVDSQKYEPYEHIVVIDGSELTEGKHHILIQISANPKRTVIVLNKAVRDFGNTPRRIGSMIASGHYLMYIDDDDYYLRDAFISIDMWLDKINPKPSWGVYPARRYGHTFFCWPPGVCRTVSCQFIHAQTINGQKILWPNEDQSYVSDGLFVESLKRIDDPNKMEVGRELVCVEKSSGGR